jgi:DNA helicase-2/ATP-dependent DNA helicase PcrA
MRLTTLSERKQRRIHFTQRAAKAWQNYFEVRGLLPGIDNPTPEQITVIQQDEEHMLINGSAGSGKSLTLLYKVLKTMQQESEPQRILYLSYSHTLIEDARKRLSKSPKYAESIANHELNMWTFHYMATQLLKEIGFKHINNLKTSLTAIRKHEDKLLRRVAVLLDLYKDSKEYQQLRDEKLYRTHDAKFVLEEIMWMKANGFIDEEKYLQVERKGRSQTPMLTKKQRKVIYKLFQQYNHAMKERYMNDVDAEDYALLLLQYIEEIPPTLKFDHIYVDEVQDLQPMQIKALALLAKKTMTISGDPKQRIYRRSPHSYSELGLNIQGRRNRKLKHNFRSTKQIMALARSLQFIDEENDREDDQIFVREGERPQIRYYSSIRTQNHFLINEIYRIKQLDPSASIAVIHRFDDVDLRHTPPRVKLDLGQHFDLIDTDQYGKRYDHTSARKPVYFTDAFSVKGLEFDYVFIIHFDRFHYPNEKRLEELRKRAENKSSESFEKDEDMIRNDEKKILYVALTRAKQQVYLLFHNEDNLRISPFARDFNPKDYEASGFTKSMYR